MAIYPKTIQAESQPQPPIYAEPVNYGVNTQLRLGVNAHGQPIAPQAPAQQPTQIPKIQFQWEANGKQLRNAMMALATLAACGATAAVLTGNKAAPVSGAVLAGDCVIDVAATPVSRDKLGSIAEYINKPAGELSNFGTPLCKTEPVRTAQGLDQRAVIFGTDIENEFAVFHVTGILGDSIQHVVTTAQVVNFAPSDL